MAQYSRISAHLQVFKSLPASFLAVPDDFSGAARRHRPFAMIPTGAAEECHTSGINALGQIHDKFADFSEPSAASIAVQRECCKKDFNVAKRGPRSADRINERDQPQPRQRDDSPTIRWASSGTLGKHTINASNRFETFRFLSIRRFQVVHIRRSFAVGKSKEIRKQRQTNSRYIEKQEVVIGAAEVLGVSLPQFIGYAPRIHGESLSPIASPNVWRPGVATCDQKSARRTSLYTSSF